MFVRYDWKMDKAELNCNWIKRINSLHILLTLGPITVAIADFLQEAKLATQERQRLRHKFGKGVVGIYQPDKQHLPPSPEFVQFSLGCHRSFPTLSHLGCQFVDVIESATCKCLSWIGCIIKSPVQMNLITTFNRSLSTQCEK